VAPVVIAQAPAPLQVPFWQLAALVPQVESATPAFLGVHAEPSVLHAWQPAEQALEQQIFDVPAGLSTQNPLSQSAVEVQAEPGSFFVVLQTVPSHT
jgi:hypothetical protein